MKEPQRRFNSAPRTRQPSSLIKPHADPTEIEFPPFTVRSVDCNNNNNDNKSIYENDDNNSHSNNNSNNNNSNYIKNDDDGGSPPPPSYNTLMKLDAFDRNNNNNNRANINFLESTDKSNGECNKAVKSFSDRSASRRERQIQVYMHNS